MTEQEEATPAPETPPESEPKETPKPEPKPEPVPKAEKPDIGALVAAQVEKELAPMRDRFALSDLAMQLGCSAEQAAEVQKVQSKFQGLNPAQALAVARMENPAAFERIGFNPRVHGAPPGSGPSPMRGQPQPKPKNYDDEIKSTAENDTHGRTEIARKHLRKSIMRAHGFRES